MIEPTWYPSRRQLRQFAGLSLFAFGFLGWMMWRYSGSLAVATKQATSLWLTVVPGLTAIETVG